MNKQKKQSAYPIDMTYEEWVSGGRYRYAEDIYTHHGNGD